MIPSFLGAGLSSPLKLPCLCPCTVMVMCTPPVAAPTLVVAGRGATTYHAARARSVTATTRTKTRVHERTIERIISPPLLLAPAYNAGRGYFRAAVANPSHVTT